MMAHQMQTKDAVHFFLCASSRFQHTPQYEPSALRTITLLSERNTGVPLSFLKNANVQNVGLGMSPSATRPNPPWNGVNGTPPSSKMSPNVQYEYDAWLSPSRESK